MQHRLNVGWQALGQFVATPSVLTGPFCVDGCPPMRFGTTLPPARPVAPCYVAAAVKADSLFLEVAPQHGHSLKALAETWRRGGVRTHMTRHE